MEQELNNGESQVNQRLIYFELSPDADGHGDLIVELTKMNFFKKFDSYYFQFEFDSFENSDIRKAISQLLEYWKSKITAIESETKIYLPIDFSDQYTGCFKMENINNDSIRMQYGISYVTGCCISPIDPGDYYKNVNDFKPDSDYSIIEVSKKELIENITISIDELNKKADL